MKQLHTLLFLILACFELTSQSVSSTEAQTMAKRFFQSKGKNFSEIAYVFCNGQDTLLYVCNAENGYVVISGDKRTTPVLAFSDQQPYHREDVIAPVTMWLSNYVQQILDVKKNHLPINSHFSEWEQHLAGQTFPITRSIEPLTKSQWGQEDFYNFYCPRDHDGPNNRVVTGCVATAMAQLIYYFRFPDTGIGSYSYLDSTYGVQFADYGHTTYNYAAMCDKPTSINDAISTLMYHCGVGVDMVYGPDGSGMYNHSAANVLKTYFKYSPQTQYVFRDSTNANWDSLIIRHLDQKIPLYYAGWSVPNINGHGFICDGYQMTGDQYFYHFNFGWNGSYNDYFYTNALNLIGTNFNLSQELIINAYPDTTLYTYPTPQPLKGCDTLTALSGSLTNVSFADEHAPYDMDYKWIIHPDVEQLNSISLSIQYNLSESDTLRISSNNSSLSTYTLTNNSNTLNLDWNCTEITIWIKTGDTLCGTGIRGNYNTSLNYYCNEYDSHSGTSGSISDGSGDNSYLPFTNCHYNIVLPKKQTIFLHFNKFDLEDGHDYLYVYQNSYSNDNLLMALTGSKPDTTIRIDEIRRIFFLFETDAHNNADGFEFDYHASENGITLFDSNSELVVFPNPATDKINISYPESIEQIEVRDMLGRLIQHESVQGEQVELNIENLSSGLYLLKINTKGNTISKKFIKK